MQAAGVGIAFVTVLTLSLLVFAAIKATVGLRVSAEAEDAGLDISEHGMYGYPEQFIPQPEYSHRPVRAFRGRYAPGKLLTSASRRPSAEPATQS